MCVHASADPFAILTFESNFLSIDKKYFKKKGREQHLHDLGLQTSLEQKELNESR